MQELDDNSLLREYVERNSQEAFATLVARHLNKVYSVALRHTRNPHSAEEITQAVFVILAQRANKLLRHPVLSGWLYETARLTAVTCIRGEIRRARREQEAYMQTPPNETESDIWPQIAPLLDAAMAGLGETDRHAIVLHYFDGKSMQEVGVTLGASEAAAKMRVNRAVEKLRLFFAKRGIVVPAAALTAMISAHSVQAAPATLANTVSVVAAAKGATVSTSTLALIKRALKIMAWSKAQTVLVAGAIVLVAAGTAITVKEIKGHKTYPWEVSKFNNIAVDGPALFAKLPPQIHVVRSKYDHFVDAITQGDREELIDGQVIVHTNQSMSLGIGVTASDIVKTAYDADRRIIFATEMPGGLYDYFVNLPQGGLPALQGEIKKQFGVVGEWMPVETNVLALQRIRGDVQFKPASDLGVDGLGDLRGNLENLLSGNIPVVDRTGLTNRYDFKFDWPKRGAVGDDQYLQLVNRSLHDQLGLEVVLTNLPVRMLVVKKAK